MAADQAPRSDPATVAPDPPRPLDQLAAAYYPELLAIARRQRRRGGTPASLDTPALLHEAFLRLVEQRQSAWPDRPQFLAAASGMMRRVLIDHLRRTRAAKRGRGHAPITLDEHALPADARDEELLALDEALERLDRLAPRLARVVECRYFGGMTELETAAALGVTERTVRRDWTKARGWLHAALADPA